MEETLLQISKSLQSISLAMWMLIMVLVYSISDIARELRGIRRELEKRK